MRARNKKNNVSITGLFDKINHISLILLMSSVNIETFVCKGNNVNSDYVKCPPNEIFLQIITKCEGILILNARIKHMYAQK